MRNGVRRVTGTLALVAACLQFGPALAQSKPSEIKIAIVQFLSGAGAPHDASSVNTAKLLTEQFNASGESGASVSIPCTLTKPGPRLTRLRSIAASSRTRRSQS